MMAWEVWLERLGAVGWPLFGCSLGLVALVVERSWTWLWKMRPVPKEILELAACQRWAEVKARLAGRNGAGAEAVCRWLSLESLPKPLREEAMNLYLAELRRKLLAQLHWLSLIATVAPLLGLLGTVLGMLEAFRALSALTGPVTPQVLAKGLEEAMLTTAVGLTIAVPSWIAGHAWRELGEGWLERLGQDLARLELCLQGVPWEALR